MEIDRQTDNPTFTRGTAKTARFAVWEPAECRFIRLTQTDKNHDGLDLVTVGRRVLRDIFRVNPLEFIARNLSVVCISPGDR
jgi:hypothetical protein